MTVASRAQDLCPPVIARLLKNVLSLSTRYSGSYATWAEALAHSSGYDSGVILNRVLEATRKVCAGEAAYERDSVLFQRMNQPFHLLAPLLRAALENAGQLSVLDYGGSLGSTYRQCREFLRPAHVSWYVVEQENFAAAGKAEFETDELRFYRRAEDIPSDGRPNVALFSSVLQYLPAPLEVLSKVTAGSAQYLVIDRTPFVAGRKNHICVQHVPRHIYTGSYPLWVFGYEQLLESVGPNWSPLAEFSCEEGHVTVSRKLRFEYRGLVLRRTHGR